MGTNVKGFIDNNDNLDKAIKAISDCEQKRRDMESYIKGSWDGWNRFTDSAKQYQIRKNLQFHWEMMKMGDELTVSVVIAVATWGETAPLAIGKGWSGPTIYRKGPQLLAKLGSVLK